MNIIVIAFLKRFRPLIQGKNVLIHTDNTASVVYINDQAGVSSLCMSQLACHLLLWSQHRLKSLHATHIMWPILSHDKFHFKARAPPSDGSADLELVRPGTSRSLCLTRIHSLPVVVWSGEAPLGGLDRHLSASTLKVHVAAVSSNHDLAEGRSVGKHDLVIRFLRGARRLNPPRLHLIRSWDLKVVLQALQQDPFKPLQSVDLSAFLTVLTFVKRMGDLQALAVNDSCLEFGPADSHIVLRPWPGYVPKIPTTPFKDQVVTLQAIPSQEGDPKLSFLCPVHALRIYIEHIQVFRRYEQLFVCFGGRQNGKAVSKQKISHWLVDVIRMAYHRWE
ncbi:hypothetical protein M9458_052933 [Cirrhinus mrigala]|uniref:Reverse transcriptase RNase H-like domain-containing protein n=1 Tax=Cirrhinus mrigala TaxID=683832 RepID=A0ABD0MSM7_CIRMR